jgi:phosphoribosylanthranilate isomerase
LRIKICGLTRPEDVRLACRLGADLCGFVLAPSPRQVPWEALPALLAAREGSALSVAVMVNPGEGEIERALSLVDRVQLHGQEPPDLCRRFRSRVWKAVRVRSPHDLDQLEAYRGCVEGYLLDSYREGMAGGTGHTFPWSYLQDRVFGAPTFLAGGLGPSNVAEATRLASVQGLDVSSGVEVAPGRKDREKLEQFFQRARAAHSPE